MPRSLPVILLGLALASAACTARDTRTDADAATPDDEFWSRLTTLCGRAYAGRVVAVVPSDTAFAGQPVVMDVRGCDEREIVIPFHVGENHSRTWIITRSDSGLRLKHDVRHADGAEDSLTQFGGDTRDGGSAEKQEFYADDYTAQLIPAAADDIWTIEKLGDSVFAYSVRREGAPDRRFRVEFDLTHPVAPPPAPWGHP